MNVEFLRAAFVAVLFTIYAGIFLGKCVADRDRWAFVYFITFLVGSIACAMVAIENNF